MRMKKILIAGMITAACFVFAACAPTVGGDNGGNDTAETVELTFDCGDGAFRDGKNGVTVVADKNGKVELDDSPVRDGYAFAGWYCGDERFDSDKTYTAAQTFTATYVSGAEDSVYDALFDAGSTVKLDIDMSDAEWKKLDRDYWNFIGGKSPIYRMADSVTVGITTADGTLEYYYEEVGVRMKGNTSRRSFYNDDGFYDSVHFKLSFTQTFDDGDEYSPDEIKVWESKDERKARKNRTLGKMEKVDIKWNSTADDSHVRDIYAMKLFRDNGIIAPDSTLCAVAAKEKDKSFRNLGVYKLFEAVDEVFLARAMPDDADGDLYKCSWGSNKPADFTDADGTVGVEDELNGKFYTYDKKTNKKVVDGNGNRDFSKLTDFISALGVGSASDYVDLIDVDYFAKFEALNYIIGNPDCIRNNANTFYIYFRGDGKAIFIPYDYDRCLGITKDWNPHNANTDLTPYTRQTAARGNQTNPLYIKLIDKGAPCGEGSVLMKYRERLIAFASSDAIKESAFDAYKIGYKNKYAAFSATCTLPNNTKFDAGNTVNMPYSEYMGKKLKTLNDNIDNYRA